MKTIEEILNIVQPYTICDKKRTIATIESVNYIINNNIDGSLVECGVFKGGQIMAMLETLNNFNKQKDIYLYDTFEGMSLPEKCDIAYNGEIPIIKENSHLLCKCSLDDVKHNIQKCNYNMNLIHFIKGKVEDTIPNIIPNNIAILRLDTDWYSSTRHELLHLYPLLNKGGVLMIDDYGHWKGAKQATDEYITKHPEIVLKQIDYTGMLSYKL